MTTEQINQESSILARTVICSFKDESRANAWLETNCDYDPKNDRVVSKALEKIKKTLRDEGFDLKSYKKQYKKS
tara:strand:- start:9 stop:230 length:222 start_codon:yes stop_codon:yes gene_type:complete